MIPSAETAQLLHASLRLALAAPWWLPIIIDRNPMPFGAAAVESRAVFVNVIFGAATHQVIEFVFRNVAQSTTLAAGAHGNSISHCLIELQPLFRSRVADIDIGPGTHHPAADVITYGPHGNRSAFIVGDQHATHGNAVAVMHVGRDDDHLHSGE